MNKRSLNQKSSHYTSDSQGSAASKFGQLIGTAFEIVVIEMIHNYLADHHPDYEIIQAGSLSGLNMFGGKERQIDNIIHPVDSDDPVAVLETKWLKDGRHHNDKGAWILQLREIRKSHPTIRGTAAILIGFWTSDIVVFLMNEGQVEAVLVGTDEQVYASLQPHLDDYSKQHDLEPLVLDAQKAHDKYERPWDLANFIQWLDTQEKLLPLAEQWLSFLHASEPNLTGEEKIKRALDKFLAPLPANPKVSSWEVTLQIDTGNLIHFKISDLEELQEVLLRYADPQQILKLITPRKRDQG